MDKMLKQLHLIFKPCINQWAVVLAMNSWENEANSVPYFIAKPFNCTCCKGEENSMQAQQIVLQNGQILPQKWLIQ